MIYYVARINKDVTSTFYVRRCGVDMPLTKDRARAELRVAINEDEVTLPGQYIVCAPSDGSLNGFIFNVIKNEPQPPPPPLEIID